MSDDHDRTAALMTPAMLAQLRMKPKADASPSAWLNQLAADAGSGHVRRLIDLRQQLEAQARECSHAAVQAALTALGEALQPLDFNLLQPKGWLARATGKGREQGAGFAGQQQRAADALEDLKESVHALRKTHQIQTASQDRTLSEFSAEIKSVEQIIEQGSRWLQDMRNQLRVRQAQVPDAQARQQIEQDEQRCDVLVERVKRLRAASSAAHHTKELCATAATRRVSLLQALQQMLEAEAQAWQERMAPVMTQAAQSGSASTGVETARKVHTELQVGVQEALRHAQQLAQQHRDFIDELGVLHKPLEAAA